MVVKVIRTASLVICVIVAASFLTFAVNKTQGASDHQQSEVSGKPVGGVSAAPTQPGAPAAKQKPREGSVHKKLDEASNKFTSPFDGVVSNTDSEWAVRGVKLILALLVYGFGLGFIARYLRVSA
jgi:hypothetical protein